MLTLIHVLKQGILGVEANGDLYAWMFSRRKSWVGILVASRITAWPERVLLCFRCHNLYSLMVFSFVVFLYHFDHDGQGNNKRCIYPWSDLDGIAVAEKGELATNLCHQVAVVVGDAEIPAPYIAVDVEDHAVAALNLKAFTEQAELFVHTRPMLTIAVNFIVGEKGENALLDMYQFLACIAI